MKRLVYLPMAALMMAFVPVSCNKDNPSGTKTITVPEAVDLGLVLKRADGTTYHLMWASLNLGASKEYEYGNYYAWGETEPKKDYSWATYAHANGAREKITKYCMYGNADFWGAEGRSPDNESKLLPSDDAAHVKLGGKWRMPTVQEFQALLNLKNDKDHYKFEWYIPLDENGNESLDGNNLAIHGLKITRIASGASIFLPGGGYREGKEPGSRGMSGSGFYWQSILRLPSESTYPPYVTTAYINMDDFGNMVNAESRCCGLSIRPVWEE